MLLVGAPAAAQSILPPSEPDVRTGDLRDQLSRAFPDGSAVAPLGWTVSKGLDVVGAYANPANSAQSGGGIGGGGHGGADFYTAITPSLSVFGGSSRIQGGLFFNPELRMYAQKGSLNQFNNNFTGQARGILLEDQVFVDVTGSSSTSSRSGGYGQTTSISRNDSVQTTSFSAKPTVQHKFDDYGTAMASYMLTESLTDAQSGVQTSPFAVPVATGPSTTKTQNASFVTGDYFGRTQGSLHYQSTDTNGTGATRNSARTNAGLDLERAWSRSWALLAGLGWEDIKYGGATPYQKSDATWNAGLQWTPNADTTVKVTYGRHDGDTSWTIDAHGSPTQRLQLSVTYAEGISTGQEDYQNAISAGKLNAAGQLVSPTTGLPITAANNFFGAQGNSAYRYKRTSANASLLGERNVYTLSVQKYDQTLLSSGTTGTPTQTNGIDGTLAFQRELNPSMSLSLFSSIGQRSAPGGSSTGGNAGTVTQDTMSLGATLTVVLSDTLTGRAQYSYTSNTSATAGQSTTQTLFLVGLHKTF